MKRNRLWLFGAFVVVSALLSVAVSKARQQPLHQLARYPKTPAFQRYLLGLPQKLNDDTSYEGKRLIIQIDHSQRAGFESVRQTKILRDHRFLVNSNGPSGCGGWAGKLRPTEFDVIEDAIEHLPPSSAPAQRDDLIIVRVYGTQPTQLRLYNKKHAPSQIKAIERTIIESMAHASQAKISR